MLQFLSSEIINLLVFGVALGAFYYLFFLFYKSGSDFPKPRPQDEVYKTSVSHTRSIVERNHDTDTGRAATKSLATYRLQGISAEIRMTEIPGLLREAWKIPESTEVTVHSLAANPRRPEKKIATVSFNRIPESLPASSGPEWVSTVNEKLVLDTHFRGFTPLHSDPDSECVLDCIAVSGLGGHAFGSFKSKNRSFMWLRDALPEDLPQSRIFLYGYDAESVNSKSFENITDLGIELQHSITQIRPSRQGSVRPLILIGHSLGGLVVKQAVINMHESQTEDNRTNLSSLRAVLFFAVPTLGMNIESLIPMVEGNPNEDLVRSLKGTSEALRRQKAPFDLASQSISKYWYYETKRSPTARLVGSQWSMTGPDALLVDPHSATNGCARSSEHEHHFVEPINRTHSEIVKFPHREDRYYARVSEHLKCIRREIPRSKNGRFRFPLTPSQSDCVKSLAIENQDSRKRSIDLIPGTCKWIQSHPTFKAWEESCTATLWIRGQPGSGKSSLMKYLVDALDCKNSNSSSPIVLSFFFHGTGLEVQRSLFGFYSALLNQLLPEIPNVCHDIFESHVRDQSTLGEKSRWEMQELKGFLSSILSKATSIGIQIIILTDALDEAGQSNAMELMQFFRKVETTAKKATDGIHRSLRICFSCRPYPIIVGPDHEIIIDVDHHNGEDLSVFVRNKLKPDPSIRIEDEVLTGVQDEIIRKTGRTFQWANLMIKEVGRMFTEMDTMSDVQEQISKTPSDLHQFYRQLVSPTILGGNGNTKQNLRRQALTLKLFQWLCFSKGPLTLATIQHALVLGPEEPGIAHPSKHRDFQPLKAMAVTVTKLSRGLVEIRTQHSEGRGMEEIVQFTHHSVYDFLLETGLADLSGPEIANLEPNARASKVEGLGHRQISRACIQAMVMEDTRTFVKTHFRQTDRKRGMLVHGSASPHSDHEMRSFGLPDCCYSITLPGLKENDDDNVVRILTPRIRSERLGGLINVDKILRNHSMQIPLALYATKYLFQHLTALESLGWDSSNLLDRYNETNLAYVWVKLWILLQNASPLKNGFSLMNTSPLMLLLLRSGVVMLLRLCLRQDPRAWPIESDPERTTSLHQVIKYGKDGALKFLIQEELKRGCIDIDRSDGTGCTPLHYAIRFGKEEAARVLIQEALNRGTVSIDHPNNYGQSPIFDAIHYNRIDGIRGLLSTGMVDVERKDNGGETPLVFAVQFGCTKVASLLLQYGASVKSTHLFKAIQLAKLEMVRFLIREGGADVHVLDDAGRTLLSHAAGVGDVRVVKYIFSISSPQLDIEDKNGKIPILYAPIEPGYRDAFDFLIRHTDQRSESFLFKVAKYGDERLLRYILEHGGLFDLEVLERAMWISRGSRVTTWGIWQETERKLNVEKIKQLMKERKDNRS